MNSLDKIQNIPSDDPFDKLIFEKGIKAVDIRFYKKLDLMIVVLNNGNTIQLKISDFPKLKKATEEQLNEWKILYDGEGFEWKCLNYDHSLKGFLKNAALQLILNERGKIAEKLK